MRSWTGPGGEGLEDCVSNQAQWWAWARGPRSSAASSAAVSAAASAVPLVWHGAWTSQSLTDNASAEKRRFTIERLADGQWRTVEWRWNPSPKAATRRWQEARWALLAARAPGARQIAAPGTPGGESGLLQPVLLSNIGNRVAEMGGTIWNYQTDGLCLQIDTESPGAQLLQVPYSADDSRLEQRAAMQLQLARRFPKAAWLTPFSLLPMPAKGRGGAKFYAVWMEKSVVKGQIWIPTKGAGPLVRARITIALPTAPVASDAAPAAVARGVIERELTALASRWVVQYE